MLVVCDEPDRLLLLKSALEGAGYRSLLAADGDSGMRLVADQRPAAVVLDVTMPVMDGWAMLRTVGAAGLGLPVVALSCWPTGSGHPADWYGTEARARAAGAAAWVGPPGDAAQVLAAVDEVLSHDHAGSRGGG